MVRTRMTHDHPTVGGGPLLEEYRTLIDPEGHYASAHYHDYRVLFSRHYDEGRRTLSELAEVLLQRWVV